MLANSLRQLGKTAASRALINQTGAQSFNGLAPFATAAAQPSDPKTVLAILYKAGPAAEEKRLLGMFSQFRRRPCLVGCKVCRFRTREPTIAKLVSQRCNPLE